MKAEARQRLKAARKNLEAAAAFMCDAILDGEFSTQEDAYLAYLREPIEELIRLHDELLKTEANNGTE